MKVKEMIKILRGLNPNKELIFEHEPSGNYVRPITIKCQTYIIGNDDEGNEIPTELEEDNSIVIVVC